MSDAPISLLLNRSAGIDTGFELTDECYRVAREIRKEQEVEDLSYVFPLFARRPYRFDPCLIAAVRELGSSASAVGSYVKVVRLHPLLAPFAAIKERDGYEDLVIDEAAALRTLFSVRQESAEKTLESWDLQLAALDSALKQQQLWLQDDCDWQFSKADAEKAQSERDQKLGSRAFP